MRKLLESRLDKTWEQPQVHQALEAIGFACGMTNRFSSHVIDLNVPPRFVCIAQVGSSISPDPAAKHLQTLGRGIDIWVKVQFAPQGERRPWVILAVTKEAWSIF